MKFFINNITKRIWSGFMRKKPGFKKYKKGTFKKRA